MIDFIENPEYAYAVGRIRALEKKLLDRGALLRLLDEPLPGVCRVLEEHGYPPVGDICGGMPEDGDASFISPEFAEFKDKSLKSAFDEIAFLSRNRRVTDLLPLRYDCLNLSWILKARMCEEALPRLFGCGLYEPERLIALVEEDGRGLTGVLRDAYVAASVVFDKGDSRLLSARVIAVYWRHFLRTARESGLPFLRRLAALHIDGRNLSTLVRLKQSPDATLSRLEDELVPAPAEPGDPPPCLWEPVGMEPMDSAFFRKAWGEPVEALPGLLAGTDYESAAIEALGAEGFDGAVFDRALDDLVGRLSSEARTVVFGIEALLAYGIAREIEISNLKIVLGGRAVGLKAEAIHRELRCGYV